MHVDPPVSALDSTLVDINYKFLNLPYRYKLYHTIIHPENFTSKL